jgi:shikimate kinase/3-dehydroquinate synthase
VAHALDRHVALVGFMGAGKSTLGWEVATRLGRRLVDLDHELARTAGRTIPELFEERGEAEFRVLEAEATIATLQNERPAVLALGGGAVETPKIRRALREHALTVHVEVDPDTAWGRSVGSGRPLARDEGSFRDLHERRKPLYAEVADVTAATAEEIVLAAAGIVVEEGVVGRLPELLPPGGRELVADATVLGLHGPPLEAPVHALRPGEDGKSIGAVERMWRELRLDRAGTIVAFGGGCTTDAAGFAASTYLRGVRWVAVPTTLVGQVDAAIGGKTGIDIPEGKNLVGAFHWPARVVLDEGLLETLPERERRQGKAELVKTQLLAGRELDVRGAAAYKAAICLRDPHDHGPRRYLNLGHTFAHALEAAADFDLPHGEAVALGLLAALRLSGRDTAAVESTLEPRLVSVDPERAWRALLRDKKRSDDAINLVLLGEEGPRVEARPAAEVRRELERLIA